jgi:hypothetical protein
MNIDLFDKMFYNMDYSKIKKNNIKIHLLILDKLLENNNINKNNSNILKGENKYPNFIEENHFENNFVHIPIKENDNLLSYGNYFIFLLI